MKLYENGLEEYPISQVLISNFLILLWIGIGAYSAYLLLPLLGYIYALLFLFLIYFLLRKLVCVNCFYYGRICSMGWGKLSSFLFSRGQGSYEGLAAPQSSTQRLEELKAKPHSMFNVHLAQPSHLRVDEGL